MELIKYTFHMSIQKETVITEGEEIQEITCGEVTNCFTISCVDKEDAQKLFDLARTALQEVRP
jgi:hypothetical protein